MSQSRNLVLVEDGQLNYRALKVEFEAAGWDIQRTIDEESTMRTIQAAKEENNPIDAIALDLGLPPGKDNPIVGGLPLAVKLRQNDSTLPILAYTNLSTQAFDYSLLLARLLPLQISFISLRGDNDIRLADFLEYVWQGFAIYSPTAADFLPRAVPTKPDPLNDQQWETLRLLSEGRTQEEAAKELPVGQDAVKSRVRRIGEILEEVGELASHQLEQADLIDWYKRHHVRYCRD